MEITLSGISLRNFKGISHLNIDFTGKQTGIFGQNATGKTTIVDAFMWCLFGKDSLNKADFEIKNLDEKGKAATNLEHSVDVSLMVSGKTLILTRTLSEKWTKKRGSAAPEFTGNMTDYFFDGVPCQKKDFDSRVKTIINEEVFRLLTDPRRFNEQLSWQERRKLLMEICGDVSDEDVIASNKKLSGLTALLNGCGIEDFKKIIAARKKQINDEIEKIPTRIDEAARSMVDIRKDIEQIPTIIDGLTIQKESLERQLADLRNGGTLALKRVELTEIDGKILAQKTAHDNRKHAKILPLEKERDEIQEAIRVNVSKAQDIVSKIANKKRLISGYEAEIETLRNKWIEVDVKSCSDPTTCPVCGQNMPDAIVNDARERFNNGKALKLEGIDKQGKELKGLIVAEAETLAALTAERDSLPTPGENPRLAEIHKQIIEIKNEQLDLSMYESQKQAVQIAINDIAASEKEGIDTLQVQLSTVKGEINTLNAEIQKVKANEATNKRILELEDQQKDLGRQYEEVEGNLFLVESFIRTKVGFLEDRINKKFSLARFKLFADQINGGLQEVCEATLNGVPYSSINNAGRIQAGLDIINALQEHYGIKALIWIDNRESIVEIPPMDCQVISLYVSEQDKTLRIAA